MRTASCIALLLIVVSAACVAQEKPAPEQDVIQTKFSIESVKGDVLLLRNDGTDQISIDDLEVAVDGKKIKTSGGIVGPGELGKITLYSFIDYTSANEVSVKPKESAISAGTISNVTPSTTTLSQKLAYDSLVAYWKLDETYGTNFLDSSGNNYKGGCSPSKCPKYTENGKANGAYVFDGSNEIFIGSLPRFDNSTKFTVEAWIKSDEISSTERLGTIFNKGPVVSSQYAWFYIFNPPGYNLVLESGDKEGWARFVAPPSNFPADQWHHVAVSIDQVAGGVNVTFYKNGALTGTTLVYGRNIHSGSYNARIGSYQGTSHYFKGIMDEIRVWNRALSGHEIKAHYEEGN